MADFPQTPEEAITCPHGNKVWFGHECGLCEPETIKIVIEWSTREYFTATREIDKAEFLEWAGNPALDEVSSDTFVEYLKSGREDPQHTYELEAMAEGVDWHDRDDPRIDGVTLR